MSFRVHVLPSVLLASSTFVVLAGVSVACSSSNDASASQAADTGAPDGGTGGDDATAADAAGLCGEDETSCGGKCVDLHSDPANCGSCGHSCGATKCDSSGTCAEQVLATGALDPVVAVDDASVYFSEDVPAAPSTLKRVPKTGGTVVPLVSTGSIHSMAAAGGRFAWSSFAETSPSDPTMDSRIDTCTTPSCATATRLFPHDPTRRIFSVASDASRVFWIAGGGNARGAVDSCPFTGCTGTPTSIAPGVGGSGDYALIAVTRDDVFWATAGGSLGHCAKTGGCTAETSTIAGTSGVIAIAAADSHAYFWTDKALFSCAAPDCAGGPEKITNNAGFDHVSLATDGKEVFFTQGVSGVTACPVTGCPANPRRVSLGGPSQTGNLVVDDAYVYYVSQSPGDDRLLRIAK